MDSLGSNRAATREGPGSAAPPGPWGTAERTSPWPGPLVVLIGPSRGWAGLNLRDLWAYRELLYFLTWRDIKVRYRQTILGVLWVILQPFLTTVFFTLFFGKLAGIPSDGIPYPLFAYAALLPWGFVTNAVTSSSNSLIGNANLITKVYFPRMIIPGAAVGAGLMDLVIGFATFAGLMAYYGVRVTWGITLLPVLVVLTTFLALGVGMGMSALNVKYRDVRHVLPFVIQLWMFATPIIYPASLVPAKWRWALALNPLAGLIEGYRAALFGRPFDWPALALAGLVTVGLLAYSAFSFRRMEKSFADTI